MTIKKFTAGALFVGALSMMLTGLAYAGGDDTYYTPRQEKKRVVKKVEKDRGPSIMDRFNDWLSGFGTLGKELAKALSNPYVAVRAGVAFYDDGNYKTSVTGYSPAAGGLDFSRVNRLYPDSEIAGTFSAAIGVNYDLLENYGGIRSEVEFGYHSYENKLCHVGLAAKNPLPPTNAFGPATADADDQYPDVTAASIKNAETAFNERSTSVCQTQEEPVYTLALNNFWDLHLGGAAEMSGMDLGAFNQLSISLGVGVGYMIVDEKVTAQVLIADANEPYHNAGNLKHDAAADANTADTVARPAKLESGLYVPLYAGVSYDFSEMLKMPLSAEVLYRYSAVAPTQLENAHSVQFGVRYSF